MTKPICSLGKGPSKRHEVFYFAEGMLGAVRIDDFKYRFIDQPNGWFGGTVKVDWPILVNLRLDPFERNGAHRHTEGTRHAALQLWTRHVDHIEPHLLLFFQIREHSKPLRSPPPQA